MSVNIHPTAVVSARAELGEGVSVGPYSVIEGDVIIGPGTTIDTHVTIKNFTEIGADNKIASYASIGADPQDWTYEGEPTRLIIGEGNHIREFVTFHRGSVKGGGVTRIGSEGMYMAYTHIAHDCQVGDHVVMANTAQLAGHVTVEDWASISSTVGVHQFARIGTCSFIGAVTGVSKDVPPYCIVAGNRAELKGLNLVGLKRRGFSTETLAAIKQAYRTLFRNHGSTLKETLGEVEETFNDVPEVIHLVEFIRASDRGICR